MEVLKLLLVVFLRDLSLANSYFGSVYSPIRTKQTDYIWDEALNVMSFHRNKMNEYLCKNYIANEIVQTYKNQSSDAVREKIEKLKNPLKHSRLARESLLADPGSQKYKDWLSRSSTLEDIYRQFENTEKDQTGHSDVLSGHEGEVTGYALLDQKHIYSKPSEYGEDLHSHKYHKEEDEDEYYEKGLKLKELFHFALTAIAFLAFACFMIEVIMCLMEVPQPAEPDYVLVPTTTGGTGHASKLDTESTNPHREGRTLSLDPMSLEILNNMSSKVLSSIEALAILHEDNGRCLERALCQSSKYSKSLRGTQKIWLPLWSLGISWIGESLSRRNNYKRGLSALEYLKAAVMGFGNTECRVLYPKCDERRKRRKKREFEQEIILKCMNHRTTGFSIFHYTHTRSKNIINLAHRLVCRTSK